MSFAVQAEEIRKSYGKTHVLRGVDLSVPTGTIFGLLGPNGAGKTTTVRILTTLASADSGTVTVNGFDVSRHVREVRSSIGLAGQYAALDERLTARENLRLIGVLYRLGRRTAARRADELLERFDLTRAADRPVSTYSGGMRRRVDLAASLIGSPAVLFLDEPTTGLDLGSRIALWDMVREQARAGVTVLLTTQYLEEADQLADHIAVIDSGTVIAQGSPEELKRKVGGERLTITAVSGDDLDELVAAVRTTLFGPVPEVDRDLLTLSVPIEGGMADVSRVASRLDVAGIRTASLSVGSPSMDDVFLSLTGTGSSTPR
jgi:ABC-2 type transport system ATP-binding protein